MKACNRLINSFIKIINNLEKMVKTKSFVTSAVNSSPAIKSVLTSPENPTGSGVFVSNGHMSSADRFLSQRSHSGSASDSSISILEDAPLDVIQEESRQNDWFKPTGSIGPDTELESNLADYIKKSEAMAENFKPLNPDTLSMDAPKSQRHASVPITAQVHRAAESENGLSFPPLPATRKVASNVVDKLPMGDRLSNMSTMRADMHVAAIASLLESNQGFTFCKLDTAQLFNLVQAPPYVMDYNELLYLIGVNNNDWESKVWYCEMLTYYALYGLILRPESKDEFEYLYKGKLKSNLLELLLSQDKLDFSDCVAKSEAAQEDDNA